MSFEVREVGRSIAAPFIEKHHYSHTTPTAFNIFFGCYVEGNLFAIVDYGSIQGRDGRFREGVRMAIGREGATADNTLEIRRLCRRGAIGEKGPVLLSDVLRECHRLLRERGYRFILSYSDWDYNTFKRHGRDTFEEGKHRSGNIYKHSGFEWLGATPPEVHCEDKEGNKVHRSVAYRKMLAHNEKLCAQWGLTLERKASGNRDRIWPSDPDKWATDDSLPPNKLWKLDQVRRNMGLRVRKCKPKDKWLLDLGG